MSRRATSTAALAVLLATAGGAAAQSYNLYGRPGLIDLPSAESFDDAQIGATFSGFGETRRTSVNFQLLPRVNGTLRVSTIRDVPGGPNVSDRSFDLQFQLLEEDGWMPGLALGFQDLLGDGPYGAEYLVATKTVGAGFTLSGGLGFGRLGSDGGFGNPFGLDTRPDPTVPGGRVQGDRYFRGDAAFFGGVAWETPVDGLTLKAEYSSDAYEDEVAGGFDRASPFNFGATYAVNDSVQLSAAYMYGSTVGVSLSFTGNPLKPLAPQDLGAGPAPVRARAANAPMGTAWADNPQNQDTLVKALGEAYAPDGIIIEQAKITGTEAELYVRNTAIQREAKAIGRVARVLALALPPSVETFRITLVEDGLAIRTAEIKRSDMEAQVDTPDASLKSWQTTGLLDARGRIAGENVWTREPEERFTWSFGPSIPLNLLDQDDGFRPDLLLTANAAYQVAPGLSVSGSASRFLVGEAQQDVSTSTSPLPRVRSDSDLYYSGRDVSLDRLTADWVFKPAPAVYARLTGGVLERMFTGVSGELLFAPVNSDLALGAELNYVRQRDYNEPFALLDYEVVTGHGSLYWDTGYHGIEAQLDAGRYLAGDWGATVSLGRSFANGWNVRGYVTRTDVSFDDFGEGSYAKGFEITMPLRWGLPFENKSEARVSLLPSENDGGARLDIEGRLYERIKDLDRRSLEDGWSAFWQ
ncbi:YjbH domain-containing protein [Oceanibium sediminis]|uniref:YjbH domain-containing protein n=1 Tax=Oceanibium sediminis TaxID=2026339 RepID=UPI000DD45D0D|nr:YjbH domain-containing protein [Oceanibium sediminis]